jgi:hypothetical protein
MVVRDSYEERVFGRSGRLPAAAARHGQEPSHAPGRGPGDWPGDGPGQDPGDGPGHRRIREDALDGIYVMAFSLLASTATACALVLLTRLAG